MVLIWLSNLSILFVAFSFLSASENKRLRYLEDFVADEYIIASDNKPKETMEYRLQSNIDK